MLKIAFLSIFLFLLGSFPAYSALQQTLYVYHNKPPYITDLDAREGLYFDIVRLINSHATELQFDLRFIPRKRLDKLLQEAQLPGFILGVNPAWFGDIKKQKYLWSSPLMYDTDEFVSHIEHPFEYYHPSSLSGNLVGTIAGYYYRYLDQKNEYSKVQRVDVNSEEALLEMVLKKRVNVAIVSRSTTEYLATKNGWKEVFYFSQNPHETYYRAIMAPESLKAEFTLLQHALDSELFKKQLVTLLKSYHLVY
ncbi:ABC transporter substrate-binding protein [Pseudoalteromonas sp. J010]|uniref:transporter substrate-binding domain-containing protein n=1 Tax=Pseudoalteromonas sp. J010 TaxID=998465 RepID=UPI000F65347E|nr:transporter substrate-binding domain-containing protein [Pseudoalteromonas sp. J010]RRS07820.1 ABC transporter substrate-binding protein [Pseudoalteromonas sp. J010]